ncbi:endonuclease III [Candidatus Marsarchaeota archaeon]|nr:endonuclease III [Candidatus Marsarchaeota archaeon]MCL5404524.1 endonuclease III [Candidatus Marsarchaeota archaeon]
MAYKRLSSADAAKVVEALEKQYPDTHYYLNFKTPTDLLAAAILSAQTRDTTVNAITPELFKRYKTAKDYANADPEQLLSLVKSVSYARNKVLNIIKAFKIIEQQHNSKVPSDMDALTALPGVGRKTANTVLINAYGIVNGIPVDTWVIKLAYRIGLSQSSDPEAIEKDLESLVDKKYWKNIAYVLKEHGKRVCGTVPKCSACMINGICPKNGVKKSE